MLIGSVEIDNPVVSAPMAGITNMAYRILAKEAGAGLVCSEMISAKGLMYSINKTLSLLKYSPLEKPISFQIFGSEPEYMVRAAKEIENLGVDIIDINMGCPVPKVVKGGEGCALMRDLPLAEKIISQVVKAVRVPVTVKIRKGWDDNNVNAVELALLAEKNGVSAITVHGRTREQLYSGKADWKIIKKVVGAVDIPVIGNGDVFSPENAASMLKETGCAAVMIGRGGMGNPWLFRRTNHYLKSGELLPEPSPREKVDMVLRHMDLLIDLKGENVGVREMRKHASWYIKGLRDATQVRRLICKAETREDIKKILLDFVKNIAMKSLA